MGNPRYADTAANIREGLRLLDVATNAGFVVAAAAVSRSAPHMMDQRADRLLSQAFGNEPGHAGRQHGSRIKPRFALHPALYNPPLGSLRRSRRIAGTLTPSRPMMPSGRHSMMMT